MAYLCTDVHGPQPLGLSFPHQPQTDGQTLESCGIALLPRVIKMKNLECLLWQAQVIQSNNLNTSVPLVKSQMQSTLFSQKLLRKAE